MEKHFKKKAQTNTKNAKKNIKAHKITQNMQKHKIPEIMQKYI